MRHVGPAYYVPVLFSSESLARNRIATAGTEATGSLDKRTWSRASGCSMREIGYALYRCKARVTASGSEAITLRRTRAGPAGRR